MAPLKSTLRSILCLLVLAGAAAAAPATAPADPVEPLRQALADLSDIDPRVREAAREQLLDLRRADLPNLRKAVEDLRPLDRAAIQQLRDIFDHVYLAEEPYPASRNLKDEEEGFLGIQMPLVELGKELDNVVSSRVKGFSGYHYLRDGDVILDIDERPIALLPGQTAPDRQSFIDAMKACRPGKEIHLRVLRGGKKMRIAVRPDARPELGLNGLQPFIAAREALADAEWKRTFAPLLQEPRP